jgi:signal transduction histidine kinase/DNA-binding response OmpR family regulator/HPt (histidine-containing phosphotransfer) domain-containing protein
MTRKFGYHSIDNCYLALRKKSVHSLNRSLLLSVYSSLLAVEATEGLNGRILSGSFGTIVILILILIIMAKRYKKQDRTYKERIEKVRERTIEAERAKDTFLANVSHETRTPMNAIIGLSHILLQSDLSSAQKINVAKIKRSAEHLLAVTNDILDYSKIEAGKLEINNFSFVCSDFFNDLADMMGINAVEKKIDLIFDISEEVPDTLIGDSLRISQVLINLLNNAIKFTDKGEVILRVGVAEHQGDTFQIRFEVKDTGIGLSEEQISRLFQAFEQIDNRISRKYGGTGLGLAISKELVEKMNGKLSVKSTFRKGSTFYFTLPLKRPEDVSKTENKHVKRLLTNKSILVLEENPYAAQLIASTLSRFHALPKIINSVNELNAQLSWMQYDAILIDSRFLPGIKNGQLLNAKSDAVVLLQYEILSNPDESKIRIDSTIAKPFSYHSLLRSMNDIFGKNITVNSVKKAQPSFDDILVLRGSRILLAEDNEGNKMVIEGLLEGSGIDITTVVNGQKAVEAIFNRPDDYELVLMDINMPVMDGYVATSIIREYQKYDNIPIIAMTANFAESDIEKSKNFGMQGHLSKPIDVGSFYRTLLQFIKPKVKKDDILPVIGAAPAVKTSATLSSLPGIDTKDGLSRLNGNVTAYQNILYKFSDLFENVTPEFTALANARAFDEGRALAHNLKGLSGNIGAKEIYELAKELEEAFKENAGEFTALIEAIDIKLRPLVSAIRSLKSSEADKPEADKKSLTPETIRMLLSELYVNAKKKKALDVKKVCKAIEGYRWPGDYQASIDTILTSAQGYQFDKIQREIESIIPDIVNT